MQTLRRKRWFDHCQVMLACGVLFCVSGADAALPDSHAHGGESPSGTYLIQDSRDPLNPGAQNYISLARRNHPKAFYKIYTYPRLFDLYFSPDERYLVIDDHSGSGSNECAVLTRIDKPPYYSNADKTDEKCWKLFWSLHRKPGKLSYDHRSTYFCEWLDASHLVIGLQGDQSFDRPKWALSGGWHCIYDAARNRAYTDKYTASKNSNYELSLH
jgi:hypothetical protein